jgi:hypothetical protein
VKNELDPSGGWPAKRVAALVLTLALATLAMYTWRAGTGDSHVLLMMSFSVVLGALYVIRGGSLPSFMYRNSHWAGGTGIAADDDPGNISPKVYLPILLIVIVAAAALYYFYGPTR